MGNSSNFFPLKRQTSKRFSILLDTGEDLLFWCFCFQTCQTSTSLLLMVHGMWYCLVIRQNYKKIEILSCNLIEIQSCNLIEILQTMCSRQHPNNQMKRIPGSHFAMSLWKSRYQRKLLLVQNHFHWLFESQQYVAKNLKNKLSCQDIKQ